MHSAQKRTSKPSVLVLSKKEYDNLWFRLKSEHQKKEVAIQDEEYREFLKAASKEMTETWENSIEKSRQRKAEEGKMLKLQAVTRDQEFVKLLNIMDEARKNEIIEKAEKLIQKNKVGPRSLESAALLSEVLQEREVQLKFKNEKKSMIKQEKMTEARNILDQAKQWMEQTTKRIIEDRKRNDDYKAEVKNFSDITLKEKQKKLKQDILHQAHMNNIAKQEAEEKKKKIGEYEQQKKIENKQNLLEAIHIKTDKKRLEKARENVRKAIDEAYIFGKRDIVLNNRSKKAIMVDNTEKLKKIVAEKYLEDQKEIEAKANKDAFALFKSKRSVDLEIIEKRENERQDQAERIRVMRVQQQAELEEKKKLDKQKWIDEIQGEAAVLMKNNLVTMAYKDQKAQDIKTKSKDMRRLLDAQLQEKFDEIREQKRKDIQLRNSNLAVHLNDDKHFYTYANDLLKDAKDKGRSTLQLMRAVDAYQRNSLLRHKDKDNRDFLFSKVPIGLTQKDRPPLPRIQDMIETQKLDELQDLKLVQKY